VWTIRRIENDWPYRNWKLDLSVVASAVRLNTDCSTADRIISVAITTAFGSALFLFSLNTRKVITKRKGIKEE
jgi:hypothetical protein